MSIYSEGRLERKIIVPILSRIVSKEYMGRIRFHFRRMARKLASHLGREVSERIIEYPWILKNLDLERKRVLDVGCSGSFLSHELIARGYDTYGIDLRFYPEKRSDMRFYQVDIRNTPFPDSFFDQIVAVSTIEHVGGREMPDNGDILAMRELSRILEEDGKMLITLPFAGKYSLKKGRNYDEKRLRLLIGDLLVEKEAYYACCGKGKWVKASKEEAEAVFSPSRPMAVVCLVLSKREFHKASKDHTHAFEENELRNLLTNLNFELINIRYINSAGAERKLKKAFYNLILSIFPAFRTVIKMECRIKS